MFFDTTETTAEKYEEALKNIETIENKEDRQPYLDWLLYNIEKDIEKNSKKDTTSLTSLQSKIKSAKGEQSDESLPTSKNPLQERIKLTETIRKKQLLKMFLSVGEHTYNKIAFEHFWSIVMHYLSRTQENHSGESTEKKLKSINEALESLITSATDGPSDKQLKNYSLLIKDFSVHIRWETAEKYKPLSVYRAIDAKSDESSNDEYELTEKYTILVKKLHNLLQPTQTAIIELYNSLSKLTPRRHFYTISITPNQTKDDINYDEIYTTIKKHIDQYHQSRNYVNFTPDLTTLHTKIIHAQAKILSALLQTTTQTKKPAQIEERRASFIGRIPLTTARRRSSVSIDTDATNEQLKTSITELIKKRTLLDANSIKELDFKINQHNQTYSTKIPPFNQFNYPDHLPAITQKFINELINDVTDKKNKIDKIMSKMEVAKSELEQIPSSIEKEKLDPKIKELKKKISMIKESKPDKQKDLIYEAVSAIKESTEELYSAYKPQAHRL